MIQFPEPQGQAFRSATKGFSIAEAGWVEMRFYHYSLHLKFLKLLYTLCKLHTHCGPDLCNHTVGSVITTTLQRHM